MRQAIMQRTRWVGWLPPGIKRLGRNFLECCFLLRSVFSPDFKDVWIRFWMRYAGLDRMGRFSTRLATWFAPPYTERTYLSRLNSRGYIDPRAIILHKQLRVGANIFIADRVVIHQDQGGGPVEFGDRVHIFRDTIVATGQGGRVAIGAGTFIQPCCKIMGYKGRIEIGCGVQIAPNCAFYSYDHGFAPGELIGKQPLQTKGGIVIGDDAWLGFGVIVLDGVRIGKGAVVGAGSVVTRDVPDETIAVGVPARVVKRRSDLDPAAPVQSSKTVQTMGGNS